MKTISLLNHLSQVFPIPLGKILFAGGMLLLGPFQRSIAADIEWIGGLGPQNWGTTTNWNGGVLPGTGDTAVFPDAPISSTINVGNRAIGNIELGDLFLTSFQNGTLTFDAGGAISSDSGSTTNFFGSLDIVLTDGLTLSNTVGFISMQSVVSGTGDVVIRANGPSSGIAMTNANTYSGNTSVETSAGAAIGLNNPTAFSGGTVTVEAGGANLVFAELIANAAFANDYILLGDVRVRDGFSLGSNMTGVISGAGGLTKTESGTVTLSNTNTYTGETVVNGGNLVIDGGSSATTRFEVGVDSGDNATLIFQNGATTPGTPDVEVGIEAGSTGLIRVTGATTNVVFDDTNIGREGTGTLEVLDGGQATLSGPSSVGFLAGGVGSVLVSGTDSRLEVGATLAIGLQGTGGLRVEDGGEVDLLAPFTAGNSNGGTGSVVVTGVGSNLSSDSAFAIGVQNGANGSMEVLEGAMVSMTGPFSIGVLEGSVGSLRIDGAGSSLTATVSPFVGVGGEGTITLSDGGLLNSVAISLGQNATGRGVLNIGDGAAAGVVNAPSVSGGSGAAIINFNHNETDYFFTSDGLSGGTAVFITGSVAVNQMGSGTTSIVGANDYSGGTVVSQGTLLLGDGEALGTGSLTLFDNVTFGVVPSGGSVVMANDVNVQGDVSLRVDSASFLEIDGTVALGAATRTLTLTEDGSDVCFMGAITGSAGLTLRASPGAMVSVEMCGPDSNTYSGTTTVGSGVGLLLTKDPDTVAIAGDLVIEDGGLVGLQTFGPQSVSQIAPTSTVTINGTGQLAFFFIALDPSDPPLGQTVAGLFGDGVISSVADMVNLTVLSGDFAGTIGESCGCGGAIVLTKDGPGMLRLTGDSFYTGPTNINGGTLQVNGSLQSPVVTVGSGGTLSGTGTLFGSVTVLSGGTLSPGTSPGIITLGNLTLNPGSTTVFEIDGATPGTQHDQIVVLGTAALGGTAQVIFGGGFVPTDGAVFTLVQAGSVTGQFADLTTNLGAVFGLTFRYSPTTADLIILITQQNYTNFALNQNQFNAAANLDTFSRTGQMPELIGLLNTLTAAQLANAFQEISPESLGAMERMSRQFNRAQGRNLLHRLEEWRDTGGNIAGTVSTSSLRLMDWAAQPLHAGTTMRNYAPVNTDEVRNPGWSLFASGTGQLGDIEGDGNGTGFDFQTGGMTIGADKKLGQLGGGDVVGGMYAGYAGSEAQIDNAGGKIEANGAKFGVFGSWLKDGLYANAQIGGGATAYDTKRNVLGLAQTGDSLGYEFTSEAAIGYEWKSGGWKFGPEVGLAYNYIGIDQFTESGGLAPLTILDQDVHSLQSRMGWKTDYEWVCGDGWWLRPGVDLSWGHEFFSTSTAIDARLASGAGGVFSGVPTTVGRDTAIAGANFVFGRGTGWTAWVGYEAEAGQRILVHSINAGTAIRF